MSTMDPRVHPMRTADDPGDLFTVWDVVRIPHLAVVGHVGDGRAAVVDRIIEHHTARQATTVMIYPALNPQLAPVTALVKGAHEAETVLQHYLAELHRRFTAIERGSTIPLSPIVIIVDSLEELLATASSQKMSHRLQLDLEAIAILGKNVGLHLVFSGNELPYLPHTLSAISAPSPSPQTVTPLGSVPGRSCPRAPQLPALFWIPRSIPECNRRNGV